MSPRNKALDPHSASGLAKHPNVGASERVRELLRSRGPQSVNALVATLNMSPRTVRSLLSNLCNRTGGVEIVPDSLPRRYRLFVPPEKRSGIVAGRIVAREQTPLRRDPFALMKLAMETRR